MGFNREQARDAGRLGGLARAAAIRSRNAPAAPPAPFAGSFLDAMDAAGLTGATWDVWRVFWLAVDGLPMTDAQADVFRAHTGRTTPPTQPAREAYPIVGRRGGKSRNAALRAVFTACSRDYARILAPGERAVVSVLAADRSQARILVRYVKGLCELAVFAPLVKRVLRDSVEFHTGCVVEVHSASFRTTRGHTLAAVLADELAFWRSDELGASPDVEVLGALRPGLATIPGALLLGLSTPYAPRGELYRVWERFYGHDDAPDVVVWKAPTLTMNPALDAGVVARAYEADPLAAAAEYGAEWRRDVEAFLDPAAIRAVTVPGRLELPPRPQVAYTGFVDPSGGSQDAFTLAVAHQEGGRAVLDLVREIHPPFSPEDVVLEYAATLRAYDLSSVTGDRYAGEWPRERFRIHGIAYVPSERTRSDLYRELLPMVNAARVELLDVPRLAAQLGGLERRVARGGRDSVDHAPGGHDDVANAAAGALVQVLGASAARFDFIQVRYA